MAKRKSLTKKTRFEVFKRDSFTCQYCGRKAPDVVLEVDHITPVAKGGVNEIINLVTSCKDCNRGKSDRKLDDRAVINKQQEQLEDLQEKRAQMKMMVEWKKELMSLEDEQADMLSDLFRDETGNSFTESGKAQIKSLVRKYGFSEVMESILISTEQYYTGTERSIQKCYEYIGKICSVRKAEQSDPFVQKKIYIKAVLKNRFRDYKPYEINDLLNKTVISSKTAVVVEELAKKMGDFEEFLDELSFLAGWIKADEMRREANGNQEDC